MNGDGEDRVAHGSGEGADVFERWYRAHHDRLLAQCMRMLRDRGAAEDIAQETLLRAWLGRERMREEDLGAWLSVVARNLCVSHIRREKKAIPTETLPEMLDVDADPAVVAERHESRRAVRRAMRLVGERHRVLLFRREVEGLDYEELGDELGLTAGGTRAVLFRARRVLRDRLIAVGEGVGAFLLGLRVRARLWANNVTAPVDAMAGSMLQVGLALAITGGLVASAAPGVATLGPSRSMLARTPVSASAPAPVTADSGGDPAVVAGQQGDVAARGGGGSAGVSPGLTPGGDLHPHGTGPGGNTIPLVDITWEPTNGPTPYPLYRRDGRSRVHITESKVATILCAGDPSLCA